MKCELCKALRLASMILVFTAGSVLTFSFLTRSACAQDANQGLYSDFRDIFTGASTPFINVSESSPALRGLSVSGFVSNTSGMWVNSSGIRYQKSKNSLATQRDWLQTDINYILNSNNRFFIRGWLVYEPPYPFEYNSHLNDMSDYYNQYDVRDAYWKSRMGPLTLFMGRQIVTWGNRWPFVSAT